MGKRRRKINNPKFATKFAKTRETYHRLRGAITETIGTAVDNLTQTVDTVVEEIKEVFKEPEAKPNALKAIKEKAPAATKKPESKTTRKKANTKKTTTAKAAPKKTATSTTKKTTTTTRRRRTAKTKTSA